MKFVAVFVLNCLIACYGDPIPNGDVVVQINQQVGCGSACGDPLPEPEPEPEPEPTDPPCVDGSVPVEGLGCVLRETGYLSWDGAQENCNYYGLSLLDGVTSMDQLAAINAAFPSSSGYHWVGIIQDYWASTGDLVPSDLWAPYYPYVYSGSCGDFFLGGSSGFTSYYCYYGQYSLCN